ncbi:hypothetical protein GCM10017783_06220 [Deinococcus piscis]|uniref:Knr4/Smi1-like domain-containing protein n=1 Tax=Deinococcus piscis TaxID=394230 RepID=A0ABQ3JZZ9_9DEIO|nr:SMI1/KNR4 family protein [Deinococcus piscis]GHF97167.1 hypothetical protein GCM10017783_06220 [Deinococcus piscis]
MTLSDDLAYLESWMQQHTPLAHAGLFPPLSGAELIRLRGQLLRAGYAAPDDVLTLYSWHGGSEAPLFGLEWSEPGMPTQGIEEDVPFAASHPPGHIRETFAPPGYWGFLHDSGGNFVALDLTPGPAGQTGQVITTGQDEHHRFVLAASVGEFVRMYVERLRAGAYAIRPPEGSSLGERVCLLDGAGQPVEDYHYLADLFPGFGASPAVYADLG